jgi:hypothetical protein
MTDIETGETTRPAARMRVSPGPGTRSFQALIALLSMVLAGSAAVAQLANAGGSDLIDLIRRTAEGASFDGRVVAASNS